MAVSFVFINFFSIIYFLNKNSNVKNKTVTRILFYFL